MVEDLDLINFCKSWTSFEADVVKALRERLLSSSFPAAMFSFNSFKMSNISEYEEIVLYLEHLDDRDSTRKTYKKSEALKNISYLHLIS